MSLSRPFIDRPVATTLLTVAIAIAGIIGYTVLPVSPLPQVDFPTIQVQASLPGASAEIMASSIATPLERQFSHIAAVTEMSSSSSLGSTNITLQFDLNRDIDGAARDVEAAINSARTYLPTNLPGNPTYRKVNPADSPIVIIGLTSNKYDTAKLYDIASTVIQQRLSQLPGVGLVNVGGGALPSVRVEANPMQLESYGLTLADIDSTLSTQNTDVARGRFEDGTQRVDLVTNGQISKAEQYRPLIVGYHNGAAVRLQDVAEVLDATQNVRAAGYLNGVQSVTVIITRSPGANIIQTVNQIRSALPSIQASIPQGINATIVLDRTTTIRASVENVEETLIFSIVLVIGVVFVFLRNPRATLIPAVAVPVSLIGTFAVMYLLNYSLDNLSLMALTIATGFVVDDAIVVMENISRFIEDGYPPREAALKGASEIGYTVLTISISLIAVFIPILLMGGIVGRLFREFAVVLSTAILVSMVVSLTTTPMMCAYLLKYHPKDEKHNWMYRLSERGFDFILKIYRVSLTWVLDNPGITIVVLLLTVAMNVMLFIRVPKGFFPEQDTGVIFGGLQGPYDASFTAMNKSVQQIVKIIKADPAVANVNAYTGGNGGTNGGFVFLALKPLGNDKNDKSVRQASAMQVIARLRPKFDRLPIASVFLQPAQDIRVGGRSGNALYQYTIVGDSLPLLNYWSPLLLENMKKLPQLADVNSDAEQGGLSAYVDYDRVTAARLGLTPTAIDAGLYAAFGQSEVSLIRTQLNQYYVVLEVAPKYWQSPEGLKTIYLQGTGANGAVPLNSFTKTHVTTTSLTLNHTGLFPSTTVSFNLAPNVALSDATAAIQQMQDKLGTPATVRGSASGTLQAFQASLKTEPLLILTALLAVYIVLGILYESLVHPITIISTLPSASVGALIALEFTNTDLSVIAIIGIVLLIGIVKKNAIMMIDFALAAERERGMSTSDAIFEACMLRFRPIMMTTMAALFGALPLAFGTGTGSELRRPLGISIVGGLLVSQALTLYTTPVIYLYLDRLRLRFTRKGSHDSFHPAEAAVQAERAH
ncbi:efflux RND transporter permease subunit [Acidipila sp. EB88]|uniref:efflux RND transporter permease subunit n=1 Tax=Acidipila sp. EB88 TaxID=2305226 RepID=UPI000F5FC772|nr:efflux RND transporter permease subunit [Acidipila sp. EB88]RRA48956.1 multidrug transporter subunit MdtC [Acidipila sp. EB88]